MKSESLTQASSPESASTPTDQLAFENVLAHPALRSLYLQKKVDLGARADYLHWIRYQHDETLPALTVQQISSHLFGYRYRASNVLAGSKLFQTDHPGDVLSEMRDYAGMKGKLVFWHPEIYADQLVRCPGNISQHTAETRLELVARRFQRRMMDTIAVGVSDTLRTRVDQYIERYADELGTKRWIFS